MWASSNLIIWNLLLLSMLSISTELKFLLSPPISFPQDVDVSHGHWVMKHFNKSQLQI